MKSEVLLAFNQICSARGLPKQVVLEALESALLNAYRHTIGVNSLPPNVRAHINLESGEIRILATKQVVEQVTDEDLQISLEDARRIQPSARVGDTITVDCTPKDFGRIAAQNARQKMLQMINEAQRDIQYEHFAQQEGEIVYGTVQAITPQGITLNLGNVEAILPRNQQVPGERYQPLQRLRAYVTEVRKTPKGPQITVSRSHKNMLLRLLENEVPEIKNGTVEVKAIVREAGSRSKVAVAARQPGLDPVGACIGPRGVRIQSIVNELNGEKIDVIEWDPDPAVFIAKALSPAKVLSVQLENDPVEGKTAAVIVPDEQLSLAIGRAGQNARLSAKLTGWRIDIQSVTEAATWALQQVNQDPRVLPALGPVAELLPTVAGALRRHEVEKLPYNNEELIAIRQVVQAVRSYYTSLRNAEWARTSAAEEEARRAVLEEAEAARRAEIEAARARIPPQAYTIPIAQLGISERVRERLQKAHITTVGAVMERLAEGDEGLLKLEGFGPRGLAEVKRAIAALELPPAEKTEHPVALEIPITPETETVSGEEASPMPTAVEPAMVEIADGASPSEAEEGRAVESAPLAEEEVEEMVRLAELPAVEPVGREVEIEEEEEPEDFFDYEDEEEDEEKERRKGAPGRGKRKRDRRRPREYIYDEDDEFIMYRLRKRGQRGGKGW